jgi:hypothetical protein
MSIAARPTLSDPAPVREQGNEWTLTEIPHPAWARATSVTPRPQKSRAVGTGHHRNCTRPMMYFLGTLPQ